MGQGAGGKKSWYTLDGHQGAVLYNVGTLLEVMNFLLDARSVETGRLTGSFCLCKITVRSEMVCSLTTE